MVGHINTVEGWPCMCEGAIPFPQPWDFQGDFWRLQGKWACSFLCAKSITQKGSMTLPFLPQSGCFWVITLFLQAAFSRDISAVGTFVPSWAIPLPVDLARIWAPTSWVAHRLKGWLPCWG